MARKPITQPQRAALQAGGHGRAALDPSFHPSLRRTVQSSGRPRGRTYYWLAGEAVEDFESGGDGPRDWPTDVAQIQANAPSLTPIQPELFWRGGLSSLPQLRINR